MTKLAYYEFCKRSGASCFHFIVIDCNDSSGSV